MSDRDWTKATDDDLYDAVDEGEPEAIAEAASREYVQCRNERDEARRYLKEAGDEMRARWNAINESLAANRALEDENRRLRTALERIAFQSADDIAVSITRLALHPPRCCTGLAPECVAAGKCLHPADNSAPAAAPLPPVCQSDDEYTAGILARQPMKPIPPLNPPCPTCGTAGGNGRLRNLRGFDEGDEGPCPKCWGRPTPEAPR